jgi:dTMP kinase
MRGKFITFEGIDGAGKSTHLKWFSGFLAKRGIEVVLTREPGGTEIGEALRAMLLDRNQRLHPETEALLVFAARREHLDKLIVPALKAGRWVVCDRFTDATYAYQSGGSGIAWDKIRMLEQWVQGELQPDITICLDVSPAVGRARSGRIKRPDRFEQERDAFYKRVRKAYLKRAREYPERVHLVDASAELAEIQSKLQALICRLCNLKP